MAYHSQHFLVQAEVLGRPPPRNDESLVVPRPDLRKGCIQAKLWPGFSL